MNNTSSEQLPWMKEMKDWSLAKKISAVRHGIFNHRLNGFPQISPIFRIF